MQPSLKYQQSYYRGMVENISQHQIGGESPSSLLYLENYNPNLEVHSLIKRKHLNVHSFGLNRKYFRIADFTKSRTSLDGADELTLEEKNNPVYAADVIGVSNPESRQASVLFGPRGLLLSPHNLASNLHRGIYVAHSAPEYDPNQEIDIREGRDYQDAISYKVDHANKYFGWFTLGKYGSHWKYGESIVFVTYPAFEMPDADKKFYAPVYKWYRWDITKKREGTKKWWEGLTFANLATNKNVNTRWKVKTPTKIAFEDVVELVWWRNGSPADPVTKPLQILISENDMLMDNKAGGRPDRWAKQPTDGIFESGTNVIQTYDDISDMKSILSLEGGWIKTLHLPKVVSYQQDVSLVTAAFTGPLADPFNDNDVLVYEVGNVGIYASVLSGTNPIPTRKVAIGPAALTIGQCYNLTDHGVFGGGIKRNGLTYDGSKYTRDTFGRYHWRPKKTSGPDKPAVAFLVTILPQYNEIGIPRPFAKDEKIPIVLTASIDGNEVPIFKGTHIVKDEAKAGYSRVINDHLATHIDPAGYLHYEETKYSMEGNLTPDSSFVTDITYFSVSQNEQRYADIFGLMGGSPFLRYNPTSKKYAVGKAISFTIRIEEDFLQVLLDQDVASLNLYVSRPSQVNSLLYSTGVLSPQEPPIGLYSLPATNDIASSEDEDSYEGYGLVKRFLISGANKIPNYDLYRGEPFNTNAWLLHDGYVWAVPVNDNANPKTNDPILHEALLDGTKPTYRPDFILWDYPSNSPPLNLQYSGEEWKGLGAKFVVNIKSLVFIGGCIGEDGLEEQAIIRYCLFQNGVPLYDRFPLENYIKIGSLPHTAVWEFREQLVWFNRHVHYRMIMPELFNPATWEFLEAVESGGTFCQKTVVNTPYGLCYANEMGVWLTEGTVPTLLTFNSDMGTGITGMYQAIATGRPSAYQYLYDIGEPIINPELGYNEYLELAFDNNSNELIVSTPVRRITTPMLSYPAPPTGDYRYFTHQLRLIFNMSSKNWRAETFFLRGYDPTEEKWQMTVLASKYGKFMSNTSKLVNLALSAWTDSGDTMPAISSLTEWTGTHFSESNSTRSNWDDIQMPTQVVYLHSGLSLKTYRMAVVGFFVTHVIGDNMNDAMLRAIVLGAIPREPTGPGGRNVELLDYNVQTDPVFPYLTNLDPKFLFMRRSQNYASQGVPFNQPVEGWVDLVQLNMATKRPAGVGGIINPFRTRMETPNYVTLVGEPREGERYQNTTGGVVENVVGRESLSLITPLNSPFRRLTFIFASEVVVKLHEFLVEYAVFKRRTQ